MRYLPSFVVALAFAACGGKVAFDGLPAGAGGSTSASNASHTSVQTAVVQTSVVVGTSVDIASAVQTTSSGLDVSATSVVVASASTGPMMPGICDSGLTDNQPGCDDCLTKNCCAEADNCTKHNTDVGPCSNDIQVFQKCAQSCGNTDGCVFMCAPGSPLAGPLFVCARKACFMECMI